MDPNKIESEELRQSIEKEDDGDLEKFNIKIKKKKKINPEIKVQ